MLNIPERLTDVTSPWRKALEQFACELRVCCPGIIQSFDSVEQTVKVKVALREEVLENFATNGGPPVFASQPKDIPELLHVPIVLPRGGGYATTFPIQKGDECLVIFADMCIDSWWTSGGVQNLLSERRHHIADGIAILAPWSQVRKVVSYSTTSMQIRSEDGTVMEELTSNELNLVAPITFVANSLINENGASGTFTSQTGQVITVQNGIITQIA